MCINPSDAHDYLANSYRPYQDRNNKLAATYDGAHGQAAQAQMGMTALQNGTVENASPLDGAGRFVARRHMYVVPRAVSHLLPSQVPYTPLGIRTEP